MQEQIYHYEICPHPPPPRRARPPNPLLRRLNICPRSHNPRTSYHARN